MKKSTKLSLTMLIAALPICLTACERYEGSSFSNLGVSYTDFEVVSHESSLILSTYNQYKHVVEIKNTGEDYALFSHPSVIFDFPGGTSRTVTSFETFICNTDESVILAPNQTTTISFITTGFDNFTGFKLTTESFKGKPVDYVKVSTPVYVDKEEKEEEEE